MGYDSDAGATDVVELLSFSVGNSRSDDVTIFWGSTTNSYRVVSSTIISGMKLRSKVIVSCDKYASGEGVPTLSMNTERTAVVLQP